MRLFRITLIFLFLVSAFAQANNNLLNSATLNGLSFRLIGPALTAGRISDLAIDPGNHKRFFVAVASGGVWYTDNGGTTFQPVFDNEGSYSIGCVTIDPNNPLVVWVGTGENNSQRSVSYGDGVYKSIDGGKSWTHMGLKQSEHIAKILVDPRNSDVVYVASQGPLWNSGGDRGLYKSNDGGATWKSILPVDEHTGVSDIVFDPRDPDVIYATTYQRRRHVWTLINGGPGSGIHKSTDGGKTWKELSKGLPSADMGRIGLAVSPANPDVVYAIVEAQHEQQGFYRSTDAGESWEKRNSYISGSPQYYQEIVADPVDVDRVYSLDTWTMVTVDGGKTFSKLGELYKHVDNHAWWIDPEDPEHMLSGNDGGLYESFDRGETWRFFPNMPITQFYRATPDNDLPFYNVYGGTQDNFTLGGPSRTTSANGINNRDWFVTLGGDGFKAQIDPENPDIIYSQYQYGGLARFDKKSGERIYIQPQSGKGEAPLRWNWDSPLIISPHNPARLYYAANILFRSDDRGNSWKAVSPDLTRQVDRNRLKVMDKVWSVDAVAKNNSTSFFGNIVSLDESPLQEGLLYSGSDDGLIQVSENGGDSWRKIEKVGKVPEMTYVSDLLASRHNASTVYATFDNHKMGDFKPYVYKSTDRGKSWTDISANLPANGTVYTIAEDHVDPNLLFAGTEYGAFFSSDGGKQWTQLKGGIPVIAVRDLEIQRRENDLVAATFGRGIYILDDYTPLRGLTEQKLQQQAGLFPVRKALMYMETVELGLPDKSFQGDDFYVAENPPFGAVFTYYLKEGLKTLKEERREQESKRKDNPYPGWDELRKEAREVSPEIILTVRNSDGNIVRRLEGPTAAGFHRVAWDLRYPPADPVSLKPFPKDNPFASAPMGPLAAPGRYTVSLEKKVRDNYEMLAGPVEFVTEPLNNATLPAPNLPELLAFQEKTAALQRAVLGASQVADEAANRINHLKKALFDTPADTRDLQKRLRQIELKMAGLLEELEGDRVVRGYSEPVAPSIISRVQEIVWGHWSSTSEVTETFRENYHIATEQFEEIWPQLKALIATDLVAIEKEAEALGAPITPGRMPEWKRE